MGFLIRLILNAAALWMTVYLGQKLGFQLALSSAASALVAVIVLALINATLGLVIKIATLPLRCLTLGLLTLVINALMFWLAGSLKIGFTVGNFTAGLFGSLAYSLISGLLSQFVRDDDDRS